MPADSAPSPMTAITLLRFSARSRATAMPRPAELDVDERAAGEGMRSSRGVLLDLVISFSIGPRLGGSDVNRGPLHHKVLSGKYQRSQLHRFASMDRTSAAIGSGRVWPFRQFRTSRQQRTM